MAGRFQGDLPDRTLDLAVQIVSLIDELPQNTKGWEIGRQLIRSGTSIGANVREADEAYSEGDFVYKCSLARKEASETVYWLTICERCSLLTAERVEHAKREAYELACILSAIVRKIQNRKLAATV
jgi:four helix bundle protein